MEWKEKKKQNRDQCSDSCIVPATVIQQSYNYQIMINKALCLSHNSSKRLHSQLYIFLQLEMEDEDTIDVFQQQTGGSSL